MRCASISSPKSHWRLPRAQLRFQMGCRPFSAVRLIGLVLEPILARFNPSLFPKRKLLSGGERSTTWRGLRTLAVQPHRTADRRARVARSFRTSETPPRCSSQRKAALGRAWARAAHSAEFLRDPRGAVARRSTARTAGRHRDEAARQWTVYKKGSCPAPTEELCPSRLSSGAFP